jgi:murein endopeptidase
LLHIHLSPPHEVCDCSDQAAHSTQPRSSVKGFTSDPAHWLETEKERKNKEEDKEEDSLRKA